MVKRWMLRTSNWWSHGSLLLLFLAISCQTPPTSEIEVQPIEFEPGQLVSAEACGQCHKDIYTFWKNSAHAVATTNENFRHSLEQAVSIEGSETRDFCLQCHAPVSLIEQDVSLDHEGVREGVGCDFCHSMTGTHMDRPVQDRFELQISEVKFGPVKDALSTGHEVAYSEFHTTSEQCAGCHEYENASGVSVLSTYSEWQDYQEAGGRESCQGCHMPLVLAQIVDPKVKRVSGSFVNTHQMPGGHSPHQLSKAVRARIMRLNKTDEGLAVLVELSNLGAGHMVPTGIPSRQLILAVEVTSGEEVLGSEERVYQRVLADEKGEEISTDAGLFLLSRQVLQDNRLAPEEKRMEDFVFRVPPDQNLEVALRLTYVYSPHDREDTEVRTDFFTERKRLTQSWQR